MHLTSVDRLQTAQHFETLLQVLPQGIFVHEDWHPLFVNQACAEILGYGSTEEILSMASMELVFADYERLRLRHYMQKHLGGGQVANEYECDALRKDGSIVTIRNIVRLIDWNGKPAFLNTILDVTERKKVEVALRASEERFRSITESCPFGVSISGLSDGIIRYCNPRLAQNLGYSVEELSGKSVTELYFDLHDQELLLDLLQDEGKVHNYELQLRRKNGAAQWALLSLHKMMLAGEQVLLAAVIDVSAMKQAQVELAQAAKLSTLGEIAAAIAHELNQPLSIISTIADLGLMNLEAGDIDIASLEEKLQTIAQQAVRMVEITEHMRLFSRREPANLTMFDPRDSVLGAVRLMTNQLQAFGIELERELPIRCQSVMGRPLQVEQVMLNLLSNARDSVLERSRRSRAEGIDYIPKIRITLVNDQILGRVRIVIHDNGHGVAEEIRDQIFEPFFTTKPAGEGTGLGLSVSYRLIAEISGELTLCNTTEGARFEISLPGTRERPDIHAEITVKSPSTPLIKSSENFSRILIVDDEALLARALADYLQQHGYETVIAGNGQEALLRYRAEPFDVVITDLWMPIMSGNELIARLREHDPILPIIAVTGHASLINDEESIGEGASLILTKPIRLQAVKEALISLQHRLN